MQTTTKSTDEHFPKAYASKIHLIALMLLIVISIPTLGFLLQTRSMPTTQSKTAKAPNVASNPSYISQIAVSGSPGNAVYDSANGCVYVLTSTPSIQAISSSTNTVVGIINLAAPDQPATTLFDSTNQKIYITNHMSNDVSVIDTLGTTCTSTSYGNLESSKISLGTSTGPGGMAYDPAHLNIYVENDGTSTISVIDDTTDALSTTVTSNTVTITTMSGGGWSHPIWYYPAGYVLVSPVDAFNRPGQVVAAVSTTNQAVTYLIAGQDPFYAVFDPSNNNMYYDNSNDLNFRISIITPTLGISSFAMNSGASNPGILAYDAANTCIYDANSGSGTLDIITTSTNTFTSVALGDSAGSITYDPTDQNMYVGTKSIGTPHVLVFPPSGCTNVASNTIDIGSNGSAICEFVPSTAVNQEWIYAVNCPVWNTGTAEDFVALLSDMDFTMTTADPISITLSGASICGVVHLTFTSVPLFGGAIQITTKPTPTSAGPVYAGIYVQGTIYTTSETLASGGSVTVPLAIWAISGTLGTYTVTVTASDASPNGGPTQATIINVTFGNGYINQCSSRTIH